MEYDLKQNDCNSYFFLLNSAYVALLLRNNFGYCCKNEIMKQSWSAATVYEV